MIISSIDKINRFPYLGIMGKDTKIITKTAAFKAALKQYLEIEGRGAQKKLSEKTQKHGRKVSQPYLNRIVNTQEPGSEEAREVLAVALGFRNSDDMITHGRRILEGVPPPKKQITALQEPNYLEKYLAKNGEFGMYEKLGGDLAAAIRILIESGKAGQHAFLAAAHQIMLAARQFDRRTAGKAQREEGEERRRVS